MRVRWILFCALGEAVGIAGVAVAFAMAERGLAPDVMAVLSAGAWEGLALGSAQAFLLARLGQRPAPWVAATAIVAILGYAGALGFGAGGEGGGEEPAMLLVLLGAALMGAGMGILMGAAQAFVGRGVVSAGSWIFANAIGWMPAMAAIFWPAMNIAPDMPLAEIALIGAAAGAVAGSCVGIATSFALPSGWARSPGGRDCISARGRRA
jgi:hypothetical protein